MLAGLHMNRGFIMAIAFVAISCAIVLCGCSSQALSINNATARPAVNSRSMVTPVPTPSRGPGGQIYGHVYLNGTPVEDAQVEAVSENGAYRVTNTANDTACLENIVRGD
jgi:hypothetical protein